jgi:hypothetical protein
LVSILAVPTALMPLAAAAQVAPDRTASANAPEAVYRYNVYAGFAYASLNQVNHSRYGVIGGELAVSRNFGRFFAVTADGAFLPKSLASGNPGNPSVDQVLFGPEVHGVVYENWSVFLRGLIGGEHSGGEHQTPNISFAGGMGGGVEHSLGPRWAVRAFGEDIASSFSIINNTPQLNASPHRRWNSQAGIGVVYRF